MRVAWLGFRKAASMAALAEALARAMRDPGLRQRLGDAAEARVRADFDASGSVRQLQDLFRKAWKDTA